MVLNPIQININRLHTTDSKNLWILYFFIQVVISAGYEFSLNLLGYLYVARYLEIFLRRATCNVGQIIYSPSQKAFISLGQDGQQVPFAAEEYADLSGKYSHYLPSSCRKDDNLKQRTATITHILKSAIKLIKFLANLGDPCQACIWQTWLLTILRASTLRKPKSIK